MTPKDPTHSQKAWALFAFIFYAVSFMFSEPIKSHAATWLFKVTFGISLGIVLASAYSSFSSMIYALIFRGLKIFDEKRWLAIVHIAALVIFSTAGLFIWIAGWEGHNTGVAYGFGIFVGGVITKLGLEPLIESRYGRF